MVTTLLQETQNTTEVKFQDVGRNWMSNLWRRKINENTKTVSLGDWVNSVAINKNTNFAIWVGYPYRAVIICIERTVENKTES